MKQFSFFIPGAPRGKGRPRFGQGRAYTDPQTAKLEKAIGWIAHQAMGDLKPFEGPVGLTIQAVSLRPQSWPKKRRDIWRTSKPDADNIVKAVLDGLNRVAWLDDAQVCSLFATKRYGDKEGIDVLVEELTTCPP